MRLVTIPVGVLGIALLAAGASGLIRATAHAQDFPSRNITIIVPTSAGGGSDLQARIIGQRLAAAFGRTVIVENRPGASGNIGTEAVVRAAADGHTLLWSNNFIVQTQVVPPKPAFIPERDLAPVSLTDRVPWILAVHPSLPVRNVKDLLALAKARPGALTFSSGSLGLQVELLKLSTNVDIRGIFYKGNAPATVALLSGEVQMSMLTPTVVTAHIKSGKVRGLAVSSLKRSTVLPDIPTLHEAGAKDYEALQWHGFLVPAKTPSATITRLHAEVIKALASSDVKERFVSEGADIIGSTPSEFAAFISAEIRKWAEVVKRSSMKF